MWRDRPSVPSPDATLGDGAGAARQPYLHAAARKEIMIKIRIRIRSGTDEHTENTAKHAKTR